MEIKKCVGCGTILQTTDPDKIGYIIEDKYNDGLYCQRCFKLIHYNKMENNDKNVDDEKIISDVNNSNAYAFFLIDLFNICDESINSFKKIKINKTLVISKSDLIFNSISINKLTNNIRNIYDIDDDIIFLSSLKDDNVDKIFSILDSNNKRECYILGYTNAGKSTLINKLKNNNTITTSSVLNTTLDYIEININDYKIIDTPGFSYKNTFYEKDDYNLIKRINTKYFVRPITYQSKIDQIFNIENLLYLKDFGYNSITFYMSNLVKIKKLYKDDNIEYIEIKLEDNSDIVISTLGFIKVKKACTFKINKKYYNLINIRKSLIN